MLCCGLLTLILSWCSMAVDTAAAVVSGGCGMAVGLLSAVPTPLCSVSSPQGTSDFCVAPDKFIMNQTESEISAGREP